MWYQETFDEKWEHIDNKQKFYGWTNKEIEDYYISKREKKEE